MIPPPRRNHCRFRYAGVEVAFVSVSVSIIAAMSHIPHTLLGSSLVHSLLGERSRLASTWCTTPPPYLNSELIIAKLIIISYKVRRWLRVGGFIHLRMLSTFYTYEYPQEWIKKSICDCKGEQALCFETVTIASSYMHQPKHSYIFTFHVLFTCISCLHFISFSFHVSFTFFIVVAGVLHRVWSELPTKGIQYQISALTHTVMHTLVKLTQVHYR